MVMESYFEDCRRSITDEQTAVPDLFRRQLAAQWEREVAEGRKWGTLEDAEAEELMALIRGRVEGVMDSKAEPSAEE